MFKTIFTTTTDGSIDMGTAMLAVVLAMVLGMIIAAAYMAACKKEGYNKNFIIGLALLPAIVAAVIMLIGSNVARAFSMAGAFALVRFRSAPGNAKDIAVVFFSMATGLACGLGYITFAAVFSIVVIVVLIVLSLSNFAGNTDNLKQLRIVIPENLNYTNAFDELFSQYTNSTVLKRVKTTNMGTMFELTYIVRLKKDINEKDFIDGLRTRNGNLNITLAMTESDNAVLN